MVHTLRLDNYSPTPRKLVLGTNSSFGTESIKIERGAGWDGLNLTATWHIPGREEPLRVALLDGDAMDVPPEVTKEAKDGVFVLAGLASGVQRASCNVEYLILEQAGVYGGADAEPTPELAAQVLEAALQARADAEAAAEDAAAAKANADKAQQAAENAAADAAKAGPYAEAALAAQQAAEDARDKAAAAQQAAENAAAAAAASKSATDTLAAEAARAALAAEESKAAANAAANLAGENATAAQQAAGVATDAANDAGQSASDAAASRAAAETAAQAAQEAQTAAQAAAKTAQDAQSAAEKARDDAQTARQGAEAARDAAAGSAEAAAKSEENAKQSADTLAGAVENVAANTAAVKELREKKAEIDDTAVGADAWSSKHIIDMLCPPLEESGNPVVCYPVAGYPLGVKTKWEPTQEGSGTPSPENIRPIKGRDSVTVERCGKNLLDISAFSLDVDKDNRTYQTKVQQLIPPGKYTLKLTHTNPNSGLGIQVFTKNGNKVSFISGQAFNLDDICDSMYFYIRNVSGNADSIKDIMLIPSTATATTTTYTPYTGQTNTLTLPKTVYGGEVDAVTGEGQETWRLLNNPSSYNYYEGTAEGEFVQSEDAVAWFLYNPAFFSKASKVLSNIFNVVSDIARTVNPYTIGGKNNYIAFRLPRSVAATRKDVKNWLASNGVEIAFEAITQTPFTATGAQPIPALAGTNTVLTDADSATVTGRADPIKRITDLEDAVASQT